MAPSWIERFRLEEFTTENTESTENRKDRLRLDRLPLVFLVGFAALCETQVCPPRFAYTNASFGPPIFTDLCGSEVGRSFLSQPIRVNPRSRMVLSPRLQFRRFVCLDPVRAYDPPRA